MNAVLTRPPQTLRIGALVLLACLALGVVSLVWTPYPINAIDVGATFQNPSSSHWLGTDSFGRDLASLLMRSLLTSLGVAALGVLLGAVGGGLVGLAVISSAGTAAALLLVRVIAILPMVHWLIWAVLLATVLGAGEGVAILAIALAAIAPFARTVTELASAIARRDYVAAATLAGFTRLEAASRHALPALVRPLLALALAQLATAVLAEATLAFLGLGAGTGAASLGALLRDFQPAALSHPLLLLPPTLPLLTMAVTLRLSSTAMAADLKDVGLSHGTA